MSFNKSSKLKSLQLEPYRSRKYDLHPFWKRKGLISLVSSKSHFSFPSSLKVVCHCFVQEEQKV